MLNTERSWHHTSPHITASAGDRHTRHLFRLMGPLLQAGIDHGLLYTFHLNIWRMGVGHRFVLGSARAREGSGGRGGGNSKGQLFFTSFLFFPLHLLACSISSSPSDKHQCRDTFSKFNIIYFDTNQIITKAGGVQLELLNSFFYLITGS